MDYNNTIDIASIVIDKGFATIMAAIIGTVIGGVITIVIAKKNMQQQFNLLQKQLAHQEILFKEEQKNKIELKKLEDEKKAKDDIKIHLENTYELLSNIRSKCSVTASFISTEINDIKSFHIFYLEEILPTINKLEMNIALYFPDLKKDIESINGQANIYWGYHHQYLRQQNVGKHSEIDMAKVNEAANNIASSAQNIQFHLKQYFFI